MLKIVSPWLLAVKCCSTWNKLQKQFGGFLGG